MNAKRVPGPGLFRYAKMMVQAAGRLKYTEETIDRRTLSQLIAMTPPEIKDRGRALRPSQTWYETGTKEGFKRTHRKLPTYYNQVRARFKCDTERNKKGYHESTIRFFGPPKGNSRCWVWCDCASFKYTLETALAAKHSSDLRNSNGEWPEVKNPKGLTFLCKHLISTADFALRQRKDLAAEKMGQEEANATKSTKSTKPVPKK